MSSDRIGSTLGAVVELVGREQVARHAHQSLERSTGILLVGAAGIGKSALASEVGGELAASGAYLEHVQCSEMTKSVPFAPLMHLLPRTVAPDPTQLSRGLIDTILTRADDRPVLLLIDDLQHSDAGTAAVMISLVTHHGARVIASTRPNDTIAPSVQSLWKDGHLERIDLEPLTTPAIAELAQQLTGSPLSPSLRTEIALRADGNPFYALALTRVGLGSGAIQDRDGLSDLARPLPVAAEIADVLRSQIGSLSPEARGMVEMIAVGENMPIELFGDIEEQQLIESLTTDGLVLVDRTTDSHATRCAHPLIGEYVRSQLPPGRAQRINESLLGRIASLDDAAPLDLLRAASIAISSEIEVEPELLLDAARVAINVVELDLAVDAALAASTMETSARSHLLAGTALWMTGKVDEARDHFDQAEALDPDEEQRARLAIERSHIAVFFEHDAARGEALLQQAYDELTSHSLRLEIGAMMIFPLAMSGRNEEAIAFGTELMQLDQTTPHIEIQLLGMLAMARFMIGSFHGMQPIVERAAQADTDGGAQSLMFGGQVMMGDLAMRKAALDLAGAEQYLKTTFDLYVVTHRAGGAANAWSSYLTTLQCLTGNLADALVHTAVALEESLIADDPMGMKPMLIASRATALAQTNQTERAVEALAEITDDYADRHRRAALWRGWANAWIVGQNDPEAGAELAATWGRYGVENGMNYWAWDVLHSAVRLGGGHDVCALLQQEADRADMALVALYARHAHAASDQNSDELFAVAVAFAEHGAWALAAEAYASAALADPSAPRASISHLRGSLAMACTDLADTPLLRRLVNPLSDHETSVAQLAAAGKTSKEIAEARFVSTRTVDNQLRSVYKKLGLSGRADLAAIFQTKP